MDTQNDADEYLAHLMKDRAIADELREIADSIDGAMIWGPVDEAVERLRAIAARLAGDGAHG